MGGHGQPLLGGVRGPVDRQKRLSGLGPGGERPIPGALELERPREPAKDLRQPPLVSRAAACFCHLTPGLDGIAERPRELRAPSESLEQREPPRLVPFLGPELERPPTGLEGVAVRVDRAGVLEGGDEPGPRALRLPRGEPVLRNQARRRVARLEPLRHRLVQGPPAPPRDVGVERLPCQGVAKAGHSRGGLDEESPLDSLLESLPSSHLAHEIELEASSRDRRRLERRPRLRREVADAEKDSVSHGIRHRKLVPREECHAAAPLPQAPGDSQRRQELLHEKGHPLGAVVDGSGKAGARPAPEQPLGKRGRRLAVERLDHELAQPTGPAQVAPEPPELRAARDFVIPVGREQEDGLGLERGREREQEFHRRLVRPLEVVEEHDGGPSPAHCLERAPDGLGDRRAVARTRRWTELGEQQAKVAGQRPTVTQTARLDAEVGAERGRERPVRRRALFDCLAPEGDQPAPAERSLGEARLPDARLASQQYEAAASSRRVGQRMGELGQLDVPADRRLGTGHGPQRRRRPAGEHACFHGIFGHNAMRLRRGCRAGGTTNEG